MSFESPARLALIIAPIVLLIAYLVVMRNRQKYALRFTSVDLLASVAPRRPGWQRHIAAALLLAALAFMVVGFAEPTRDVRVPRKSANIIIALDTSTSMIATDVAPTRLGAAQAAAKQFLESLPPGLKVGLLTFDRTARINVAPTDDRATTAAAIDSLTTAGGTATGEAIYLALDSINAAPKGPDGKPPAAAVVLLSDGTPTIGRGGEDPRETLAGATAAAKEADIRVDTIAFGTPGGIVEIGGEQVSVPADPEAMAAIAEGSGGKSFTAENVTELRSVYDQIRRAVGYETEPRDMTVFFIGVALVTAVLAAGAALVWSQRLL
jgi:Ca-activated chloride channel family protein